MKPHPTMDRLATLAEADRSVITALPAHDLKAGDWMIANDSMPNGGEVCSVKIDCDGVTVLIRTLDDAEDRTMFRDTARSRTIYRHETIHPDLLVAIYNDWSNR